MKSLKTLIFQHFFVQALLPILLIEFSLIITLFSLNDYQSQQNKAALEKITDKAFTEIAHQTTQRIEQYFLQAKNALDQLSNTSIILLQMRHTQDQDNENYRLYDGFFEYAPPTISKNGFYQYKKPKQTAVYTTNLKTLQEEDYAILNALVPLKPIAQAIIDQEHTLINNVWLNIDKRYAFAYPEIQPQKVLTPQLDVTKFSFYYDVDPTHNPNKSTLFTPLYTQKWALENGELGAYISPIYLDKKFMGVAGFTLNITEIAQVINQLKLPFEADALLLDRNNTLIASSFAQSVQEQLGAHSFYQMYHDKTSITTTNMQVNLEQLNNKHYISHIMPIEMTGLKLMIFVDKETIFAPIERVSRRTIDIGMLFIIAIALFYLFFFWFNYNALKKLSTKITTPLKAIVDFSSQLGRKEKFKLITSPIEELETLNVNLNSAHQELLDILIKDSETQLFNRHKLTADLLHTSAVSLSVLHIKNYRTILNYYGLESAMALLQSIILHLKKEPDLKIYRIADSQLALMTPQKPKAYFESLLLELNTLHINYDSVDLHPFVYAGISRITHDNKELEQATLALQHALDNRVSTPIYYEERFDQSQNIHENLLWAGRLKEALEEDRIQPYFQPIYNLKSQKIEKFEALVRIVEGTKSLSPFYFLQSAEKMGRMHEITMIMIEKVYTVAAQHPALTFSINLSFKDIQEPRIMDFLIKQLVVAKIKAKQIVIELLETENVDDQLECSRYFEILKKEGFAIAIDDFGTGHSNFANLSIMSVDFIKIDGLFIKDIVHDTNALAITKSINTFAKVMQAQSIAEYVEDEETLQLLKDLEIDFIQGYVISEAVPAQKINTLLQKFNQH